MVAFAKRTLSYLSSGVSTFGALFPYVPAIKNTAARNVAQDFMEAGDDLWHALKVEAGRRYEPK